MKVTDGAPETFGIIGRCRLHSSLVEKAITFLGSITRRPYIIFCGLHSRMRICVGVAFARTLALSLGPVLA